MDRHIPLLEEHARRQLMRGDVSGAIETLRQALGAAPDESDLHALLAAALLAGRRRHAARVEASAALALDPESVAALRAMGFVHMAFRELKQAAAAFRQAEQRAPDDPLTHFAMGQLHLAAGRSGEARAAWERALALDPGDPDTLVAIGDLNLVEGRRESARACALEVLAAAPEHTAALALMGRLLLAEGRTDEAREHAVAILRQDAGNHEGLRLLCSAKARRSRLIGLWWRWNSTLSSLGNRRAIFVLVGLYVAQRIAVTALTDVGATTAASLTRYAWTAFAIYTWIGPPIFARSVAKELETVRLRSDF